MYLCFMAVWLGRRPSKYSCSHFWTVCKMLFLVDNSSWRTLQNTFSPLIHKGPLGKDCSLSCKPWIVKRFYYPSVNQPFWHHGSVLSPFTIFTLGRLLRTILAIDALCGPWPSRTTWFLSSESWFDPDGCRARLIDAILEKPDWETRVPDSSKSLTAHVE